MFKILDEKCTPVRGTKYSAYVDLFAREDVIIGAGETKVIKLGVKLDLDKLYRSWYFYTEQNNISGSWDMYLRSHYLEVALRSSLAVKGLIIANGIGIIDLDYPDEIGLILQNPIQNIDKTIDIDKKEDYIEIDYYGSPNERADGIKVEYSSSFKIKKGDKVAQCTLKEHKGYLMGYESDKVRDGGFGSTGAI